MLKRTLLGFTAIAASTSCVPPALRQAGHVAALPVRDAAEARTLLAGLALDAPVEPLERAFASPARLTDASLTPAAAPAFTGAARSEDDRQRALACLTAAVYYEARSESTDGQRAVAQVVLNRVRDRAFPHSVCGVVYQGSTRRTGCQFSFTCDGSMNRPRDESAWARAASIARAAFDGSVFAPIGASTSYHAASILPWWAPSLSRVGAIGAHVFYRWRGAMERALTFRQRYAGLEPDPIAGPATALAATTVASGYTRAIDSGVTVHRGRAAPDAEATAPSPPASALASTMPSPRLRLASGVRIHVGTAHGGAVMAASSPLPVIAISEESDPT